MNPNELLAQMFAAQGGDHRADRLLPGCHHRGASRAATASTGARTTCSERPKKEESQDEGRPLMTPDVTKELNSDSPELSEFHQELLTHVKKLVRMSRSKMSKYYDQWDQQQAIYKGERQPDKDDVEMSKREKPVKMVVPSTFAQVMTFTSFLFLLYTQNKTFYELLPTGDEDYGTKMKDIEKVMERDCRANAWNSAPFPASSGHRAVWHRRFGVLLDQEDEPDLRAQRANGGDHLRRGDDGSDPAASGRSS